LLVPVVGALVWFGPWSYFGLLAALAVVGGLELAPLLERLGWTLPGRPVSPATSRHAADGRVDPASGHVPPRPMTRRGAGLAFLPLLALVFFVASVAGWLGRAFLPLTLLAWLLPLFWLFRPLLPSRPADRAGGILVHVLGAGYVGLLLACFALLQGGLAHAHSWGPGPVFYAVLIIWGCDTGSYAGGRLFGRRKLWPAVSPGKTWEGAIAGFVVATVVGALGAPLLGGPSPIWKGALLGAAAGVAGQLGDLIESRVKRLASVKDASRLIPGHGGMLDRLDSILFAAPILYLGLRGLK